MSILRHVKDTGISKHKILIFFNFKKWAVLTSISQTTRYCLSRQSLFKKNHSKCSFCYSMKGQLEYLFYFMKISSDDFLNLILWMNILHIFFTSKNSCSRGNVFFYLHCTIYSQNYFIRWNFFPNQHGSLPLQFFN